MPASSVIVLGGAGLVGSAVSRHLQSVGHMVYPVERDNYSNHIGRSVDVIVNCNGNSYRFRANQDPRWDFEASVATVERSLFDISAGLYIYISSVDVYPAKHDPVQNRESCLVSPETLDTYGFHKWLAERLVEKFAKRWFILRLGTVLGPGLKKGPLFDLTHGTPIFMSLDSKLSLIDTSTIARVVEVLIEQERESSILNVTGTGSVMLRDLAKLVAARNPSFFGT